MEENNGNKNPATKLIIIGVVVLAALAGLYFLSGGMGGEGPAGTGEEEIITEEPGEEEMGMEEEMEEESDVEATEEMTIVEVAQSQDNFSILVSAIEQAELVETLSGEGPFTVFAPTNAAFQALPEETLQQALNDKELLTEILTYHVVPGKVMSDEVVDLTTATTVQGSDLTIEVMDGNVMVDDATVVSTDIEASNGVIHVIDTVLMPE